MNQIMLNVFVDELTKLAGITRAQQAALLGIGGSIIGGTGGAAAAGEGHRLKGGLYGAGAGGLTGAGLGALGVMGMKNPELSQGIGVGVPLTAGALAGLYGTKGGDPNFENRKGRYVAY